MVKNVKFRVLLKVNYKLHYLFKTIRLGNRTTTSDARDQKCCCEFIALSKTSYQRNLVNNKSRAKWEAIWVMINLLPRAMREVKIVLVHHLFRVKRESIGDTVSLVLRAKRKAKGLAVSKATTAQKSCDVLRTKTQHIITINFYICLWKWPHQNLVFIALYDLPSLTTYLSIIISMNKG